jgi:hypothetical protein
MTIATIASAIAAGFLCYAALRQEQATYDTAHVAKQATARAAKIQADATYRSLLYNKQVDVIGDTFQLYDDVLEKISEKISDPGGIIVWPDEWSRQAIHSWYIDISKASQSLQNQSGAMKMLVPDDVQFKLHEAANSLALLVTEASPSAELFPSLTTSRPEEELSAHKMLAASAQFGSLMMQAPQEEM